MNWETKIIHFNGEESLLPDGGYFSLAELQKIVDGYIEVVATNNPDYILIVNEEGKLENLPYNSKATNYCSKILGEFDYICGNAVLCKTTQLR